MLEFFAKFELTFNRILFKKNSESEILEQININSTGELNTIIENSNDEITNFMKNLNIGNLIPLKCGHNGMLSREDLDCYRSFLISSKIII